MSDFKLTILYLDDSEAQLANVGRELSRLGHDVRLATRVGDATRSVNAADLVMIDFHMPDIDGAEALSRLRKAVRGAKPIAFYLYTSDREVATSYKSLGFDGAFVEKGDSAALPKQVEAAGRMLQLRRFRYERQKA